MKTGFLQEQRTLENDLNSDTSHKNSVDFLMNWFRKQSIFVLAYGTGCGAIEMPPTLTSRYDAERWESGEQRHRGKLMLLLSQATAPTKHCEE